MLRTDDYNVKECILQEIGEQYWGAETVAVALAAKKASRLLKGGPSCEVVVLHDGADNQPSEFSFFIKRLAERLDDIQDVRFQIALYLDYEHWLAIDVEIVDHELFFFIVDSTSSTYYVDPVCQVILSSVDDATVFVLNAENPVQRDGNSCSRFMLMNLFILQRLAIFNELRQLQVEGRLDEMDGVFYLVMETMPASLIKLLRPHQRIDAIVPGATLEGRKPTPLLPDYLRVETPVKINRKLGHSFNLFELINKHYLEDQQTKDVPGSDVLTRRILNTFIHFKKAKYKKQICSYFDDHTNQKIIADINERNGLAFLDKLAASNKTPLSVRAFYNAYTEDDRDAILYHLINGYRLDTVERGESVVSLVLQRREKNAVKLVLAHANLRDESGMTALMRAVLADDLLMVKRLLELGVDTKLKSYQGKSARKMAKEQGSVAQAEAIKNAKNTNRLRYYIRKGQLLNFEGMMSRNPHLLDYQYADGQSLLHLAVLAKNKDLVKLLLDYGIDTALSNNEGETALDLATSRSREVIHDLIIVAQQSNSPSIPGK